MGQSIPARPGRAFVTGAGRGIGAAIATRLEADGFDVTRLDVAGDGVVHCDVTEAAVVADLARAIDPATSRSLPDDDVTGR